MGLGLAAWEGVGGCWLACPERRFKRDPVRLGGSGGWTNDWENVYIHKNTHCIQYACLGAGPGRRNLYLHPEGRLGDTMGYLLIRSPLK